MIGHNGRLPLAGVLPERACRPQRQVAEGCPAGILPAAIHKETTMRHYEIVFLVHPDQSEQVPAMIERLTSRSNEA